MLDAFEAERDGRGMDAQAMRDRLATRRNPAISRHFADQQAPNRYGLSRRRSRVRVPSLPFEKCPEADVFLSVVSPK